MQVSQKKYSELFDEIVVKHLHALVESLQGTAPEKVLVTKWRGGIQYNWCEYIIKTAESNSDFIARLSMRLSGYRTEFNNYSSKEKIIKLLLETLDASMICYFDFGLRKDVNNMIKQYCTQVDAWMGEPILTPKFDTFKQIEGIISTINAEINVLKGYGSTLEELDVVLNKDFVEDKESIPDFTIILQKVVHEYILLMKENAALFPELLKSLNAFEKSCKSYKYFALSKKDTSQVKQLQTISKDKEILKEIVETDFTRIERYTKLDSNTKKTKEIQDIYTKSLEPLNQEKILKTVYILWLETLETHLNSSTKILKEIEEFIDLASSHYAINEIKSNFKKILNLAFLNIKIINFLKLPRKDVKVQISVGPKVLYSGKTNKAGQVFFEEIPKETLKIHLEKNNKVKDINIPIKEYYTNKEIIF